MYIDTIISIDHSINTGGAGITCSMGEFKITCHDKEDFELVKLLLCLVTSLRSLPAATDVRLYLYMYTYEHVHVY